MKKYILILASFTALSSCESQVTYSSLETSEATKNALGQITEEAKVSENEADLSEIQLVPNSCLGDVNQDNLISNADLLITLGTVGTQNSNFDFNNDGTINTTDINWIANHFGICQGLQFPTACDGDLDQNGVVSNADLLLLLGQLGQTSAISSGDLDGDGQVNNNDIELLQSLFGQSCSSH